MNEHIRQLAMKDATVSRWAQMFHAGHITYTRALEGMVVELALQKENFFELAKTFHEHAAKPADMTASEGSVPMDKVA